MQSFTVGNQVNSIPSLDVLQKEWSECRSTIGRLDGTLLDLRKSVFGFVTGLLGASGLVGSVLGVVKAGSATSTSTASVDTAGSTVIALNHGLVAELVMLACALVVVLFFVDRYYSVLQWGAINRARTIEAGLGMRMTETIHTWVTSPGNATLVGWIWTIAAPLQYGSYVLAACTLGFVLIGDLSFALVQPLPPATTVWLVGAGSGVVIVILFLIGNGEWKKLGNVIQPALPAARSGRITLANVTVPASAASADVPVPSAAHGIPKAAWIVALVKSDPALQGISINSCRVQDDNNFQFVVSNTNPEERDLSGEYAIIFVG